MRHLVLLVAILTSAACASGTTTAPPPAAPMANETPPHEEVIDEAADEDAQANVEFEEAFADVESYDEDDDAYAEGDPCGDPDMVGGVVSGVVGGVVGGYPDGVATDAPPPPPPPPPPPEYIAPAVAEALRISGDKNIVPDQATKDAMIAAGVTKTTTIMKVCMSTSGAVSGVTTAKSSGYPTYDDALRAGIHTWRYRPYMIDGAPSAVCTVIVFVFQMKP